MYVPTVSVSTEPDEDTVSPPSEVAPASVYVEPSSTVAGLSPWIVMIGKIVSGGVAVSSEILSATITPANMSSCSIIESSKRIVLASTHFPSGLKTLLPPTSPAQSSSSASSTSRLSSSIFFLSTSSSVEYASTLSVISAISSSVKAKSWFGKLVKNNNNKGVYNLIWVRSC